MAVALGGGYPQIMGTAVSIKLTSRRTVDLCRVGSCLCRIG
jgi:hypothetical protein